MQFVGRLLSGTTRLASWLGALCIVFMMLHVTADVAGRYLFNAPLPGTIVIVGHYYMIIVVFLALGVAEQKRAHISVEFLTDMMPKTVQRWLAGFSALLTAAVFTLLAIGGFFEAMKKTKYGASIEHGSDMIAVWPSYWAVPAGAALIAMIAASRVARTVFGLRSPDCNTPKDAEMIYE